jgi:transposase-like protein
MARRERRKFSDEYKAEVVALLRLPQAIEQEGLGGRTPPRLRPS